MFNLKRIMAVELMGAFWLVGKFIRTFALMTIGIVIGLAVIHPQEAVAMYMQFKNDQLALDAQLPAVEAFVVIAVASSSIWVFISALLASANTGVLAVNGIIGQQDSDSATNND